MAPEVTTHTIHPHLLKGTVRVLVVGAGGNGGVVLEHLLRLHQALVAWGHPGGLEVTLMDGDTVSETNCVRQSFAYSDLGHNKATILINRVNVYKGTKWHARPEMFTPDSLTVPMGCDQFHIVIGCVDTKAARRAIAEAVTKSNCGVAYYLDLGNSENTGQYVLGEPLNFRNRRKSTRLRCVYELYPEMLAEEEDPGPSCSAVEALERQGPLINCSVAAQAVALLTNLFRRGMITYQGGFVNTETGMSIPLKINNAVRLKQCRKTSPRTALKHAA
jgi:PRTRC genetic system ThiF family protein